ncbi:MAG TPA: right-handed parallel beta-helix repeat-containing protein, partial [Rudaea sp.]|nr:right-handed parallel beta-helix repeat-containing protein [Rudaea sp.]
KSANPGLGEVDYGLTEAQSVVYVDATYSGQSFGTSLAFPFSNPNGACAATTAYFGINAFATIADGLMHVTNAGTVCIAKSNYAEAVNITNNVQMIGDGNTAGDTVIAGAVTLNAGGIVGAPLLMQNLRVTNASGKGVAVGAASHLAFYGVAFADNGDAGLDFDSVIDDVAISGSLFDANTGAGIRTATTAQVSNVTINGGTVFSNNAAGIILFGASGSGNGQISNWTIDSSQFLSNDNADASNFGGAIWLKTGGAGSAINGFTVTNSIFADNGSSNTLNQVGITVRARPGTTMTGVNICNNTFEETAAPGTQLTGINVFDDTANTGYQPIAVCASNTFSGLGHSISGLEQHNSRGTQPVVNITGGAIANTEYINTPVIRVRDGAKFPTIGLAMNDAGTTAGDEIHAPAGFYRENVTVTHNGMTLSGDGASTVIDGVGLSGSGVTIPNGETGATLHDFTVQNFTAIGTSSGACIYGALSNSDTAIRNTTVANCAGGRGGIFLSAGAAIDNVTIDNNDVSQTDGRGIVIWDGQKTHIAITNNHVHDLTGCCGIELQDGSAS